MTFNPAEFTPNQLLFINSKHTNEHLKKHMIESVPIMNRIKKRQQDLFLKLDTNGKIESLIESELEFIEVMKSKGYDENTPLQTFSQIHGNDNPNHRVSLHYPIKSELDNINRLSKLLK